MTSFRLLNLDPALVDQIRNHLRAVRHAGGFHPASASKVLHDLPLTGIGKFHRHLLRGTNANARTFFFTDAT